MFITARLALRTGCVDTSGYENKLQLATSVCTNLLAVVVNGLFQCINVIPFPLSTSILHAGSNQNTLHSLVLLS